MVARAHAPYMGAWAPYPYNTLGVAMEFFSDLTRVPWYFILIQYILF